MGKKEPSDGTRPVPPHPNWHTQEAASLQDYGGDNEFILDRSASVLHLAFIAFFLVSGGPVGIEQIIQAGGPLLSLIGLLVFPLLWSIPQALTTSEMATMMPLNGSYVIWTERAFGDVGGWMNGYLSIFSNSIDLGIYPTLVADYLSRELQLSHTGRWIVIVGTVLLVVALNLGNVRVVGSSSVFFFIIVMTPFVIQFFVLLFRGSIHPEHLLDTLQSASNSAHSHVDLALFINVLVWNFGGWDDLGSIAGEIQEPHHTYPKAVAWSVVIMTFSCLIPLLSAVSIATDWSLYVDGYFVDVAKQVGAVMGWATLISTIVSVIAVFNTSMASYSRALWRVGQFHFLPEFFAFTGASGTPFNSIIFHAVFATVMCVLSFDQLIAATNFMTCCSLLMEKSAFLYLKFYEPEAVRPFAVPGGKWGGLAVTLPVFVIIGLVMFYASWHTWLYSTAINLVFLLMFFFWKNGLLTYISPYWGPHPHQRQQEAEGNDEHEPLLRALA